MKHKRSIAILVTALVVVATLALLWSCSLILAPRRVLRGTATEAGGIMQWSTAGTLAPFLLLPCLFRRRDKVAREGDITESTLVPTSTPITLNTPVVQHPTGEHGYRSPDINSSPPTKGRRLARLLISRGLSLSRKARSPGSLRRPLVQRTRSPTVPVSSSTPSLVLRSSSLPGSPLAQPRPLVVRRHSSVGC